MDKMKVVIKTAVAALFLAATTAVAHGEQTFCVRCTSPDGNYLCTVNRGIQAGSGTGMKLFCIERAAKEAGHGFCSIQNKAAACEDVQRRFVFSQPVSEDPAIRHAPDTQTISGESNLGETISGETISGETMPPAEDAAAATQPKSAKTVVELTQNMAKSAKQGMNSVNKTVGSAMKKTGSFIKDTTTGTWTCLSSLFSKCGASNEASADAAPQPKQDPQPASAPQPADTAAKP